MGNARAAMGNAQAAMGNAQKLPWAMLKSCHGQCSKAAMGTEYVIRAFSMYSKVAVSSRLSILHYLHYLHCLQK